jgi:hypothetical protein
MRDFLFNFFLAATHLFKDVDVRMISPGGSHGVGNPLQARVRRRHSTGERGTHWGGRIGRVIVIFDTLIHLQVIDKANWAVIYAFAPLSGDESDSEDEGNGLDDFHDFERKEDGCFLSELVRCGEVVLWRVEESLGWLRAMMSGKRNKSDMLGIYTVVNGLHTIICQLELQNQDAKNEVSARGAVFSAHHEYES